MKQTILFLIRKIYRKFGFSKKTELVSFPYNMNSIVGYKKPFFSLSKDEGFFTRYYQEHIEDCHNLNKFYHLERMQLFKYEILWAKKIIDNHYKIEALEDCVIPISGTTDIHQEIEIIEKDQNKVINFNSQRFNYFKLNKGQSISINSKNNFLVGNKISLKNNSKSKSKYKLVLFLFVDGLCDIERLGHENLDEIMPNTYNYFSKGKVFKNHHANGEWTLSSFASLFTGGYSKGHKFFHPRKMHVIGKGYDTLGQLFSKKGYHTFQVGSGVRVNPGYGYVKGFDRTILKNQIDGKEVISEFMENCESFKNRDQFVWLNFNDIHHFLKQNPSMITQTKLSYDYLEKKIESKVKSPFADYNQVSIQTLKTEMTKLDFYLETLYKYLNHNYSDDEILVNLTSDHGHSFLDKTNNVLSVARSAIPWLIRAKGIEAGISKEMTENVDVFRTIVKKCELEEENILYDGNLPSDLGGVKSKDFAFMQSIFPGQTYKCAIKDKKYEFFFETEDTVDESGKFKLSPYKVSFFYLNSNSSADDTLLSEKYENICIERSSSWLNTL